MHKEKIRLYGDIMGNKSSVVGFSMGLSDTVENASEELSQFFESRSQSMKPIDPPQELQHITGVYYEITPPLEDEQVRRFARICIKHANDGRKFIEFIDNRETIPERSLQIAGSVVDWVG